MRREIVLAALLFLVSLQAAVAEIRLGIIGTDTSHAMAFTKILNDPAAPGHVPGTRVVAAFKGGSPDVEASYTRVDRFAEELRTQFNVEIVPDIATLLGKVDAILLLSVDGRTHLEQARPVIAARKRLFIDKPLASTLADAREIARLAGEAGVPWFTSSSLRYGELVSQLQGSGITGASTWGPGPFEPHHELDLSWYAIHPIEMLFALLGPGCREVSRFHTESQDVLVGRWQDGRLGVVRVLRPRGEYGAIVFRGEKVFRSSPDVRHDYAPLAAQMVKFFQTGQPPIPNAESLEIFSFMDAAQRSKPDGRPVELR